MRRTNVIFKGPKQAQLTEILKHTCYNCEITAKYQIVKAAGSS